VSVDGTGRQARGLQDDLDLLALDGLIGIEEANRAAAANDFLELHGDPPLLNEPII
jgi:hypothetical protein